MQAPLASAPGPARFDKRASVAAALLLLAAAGGMAWAGYLSLAMLNLPAPVIDTAAAGPVGAAFRPPRRVLLVVIDGLGQDAAAAVPAIAALGERGAWVDLAALPPTFSSAQYVAFLTGVGPVDSGVRTNLRPRRTALDSVVNRVCARGGRAVEVGDEVDWWARLFAWDEALVVPSDAILRKAARLILD